MKKVLFSDALKRGGVFKLPPLATLEQALLCVSQKLSWEGELDRSFLFRLLMEREKVMSTAIGKGVAIPHPRNAKLLPVDSVVAGCFYLDTPLDMGARDRERVWCLFVLISPDTSMHLKVMKELAHCLQIETFFNELQKKPELDRLCQLFQKYEDQ
ncbi:MAG: hypothetical protein CSA81_06670 [Acidobacteria bacterium]|nr:MAG: hypothetical protein CSA81_06670 [Acidobacteriota bacterium]PIE90647.1 MAG: hypothetical protein CR997_05260 [Acidobacteriota bacterium]